MTDQWLKKSLKEFSPARDPQVLLEKGPACLPRSGSEQRRPQTPGPAAPGARPRHPPRARRPPARERREAREPPGSGARNSAAETWPPRGPQAPSRGGASVAWKRAEARPEPEEAGQRGSELWAGLVNAPAQEVGQGGALGAESTLRQGRRRGVNCRVRELPRHERRDLGRG